MGKLTCGCLNVKISVKSSNLRALDVDQLGSSKGNQHEFFTLGISEVQLSLEGTKVEHASLLKRHLASDWLIHECVNCEMLTHAVHNTQGTNKVLVNMSLKSDPTIIGRLAQSAEYSPLYKIVMGNRVDNNPAVHTLGVHSGKYESLQRTLTTIQQQLNKFLIEEESAMEERIRHYEETQRLVYAELQSKARRDKNTLINLVLTAEQFNLVNAQTATARATAPSQVSVLEQQENNTSVDEVSSHPPPLGGDTNSNTVTDTGTPPPRRPHKPVQSQIPLTSSTPQPLAKQQYFRDNQGSPDADGLFDFDPSFSDERDQPFYESEEETEDTDDSSITEEIDVHFQASNRGNAFYSTSVPISVPLWKSTSKRSFEVEHRQEREATAAPKMENMAASIKALARSVHVDGTEMFGERPRPRVHTKDLGNV